MATTQILELSHDIKGGVNVVDHKVDQLIKGTFSAISFSQMQS